MKPVDLGSIGPFFRCPLGQSPPAGAPCSHVPRSVENTAADKRLAAEADLRYARAARLYFQSAANQTRFVLTRNALADGSGSPTDRKQQLEQLRRILQQEIAVVRAMFTLAQQDSCVGFEAASQYFYLPLDLAEKAFSCRLIADELH